MKKQDKHPIDNYFKENIQQDFPFDPALWSQVEKSIVSGNKKKYKGLLYLIPLLFISGIAFTFYLLSDKQITNNIASKSQNNTVTYPGHDSKSLAHDTDHSITQSHEIGYVNANKKDNNYLNEQNQKSSTEISINSKSNSKHKHKEVFNNSPVDISNNKEAELNETPVLLISDKVETSEKEIFELFNLQAKSLLPIVSIKEPLIKPSKEIKLKERKWRLAFELEYLGSLKMRQEFKQISIEHNQYNSTFETPKQYNLYSLNTLIERKGWSFITGIGLTQAETQMNFKSDTNHFIVNKIPIKTYIMLQDSLTYSGGFYSKIKVVTDTILTRKEPLKDISASTKWQWVSVPLKVGYQFNYHRLRFGTRVGADLMWLNKVNGTVINNDMTTLTALTDLNPKKFNISTSAQVMLGYQLHRHWQLGGSYFIHKQLGSNLENYNHRFSSHGGAVYLRWVL